jgi:hypothetical protein
MSLSPEMTFQSLSWQESGLRSRTTSVVDHQDERGPTKSESESGAKTGQIKPLHSSMEDLGLRIRRSSILVGPEERSPASVPYLVHAKMAGKLSPEVPRLSDRDEVMVCVSVCVCIYIYIYNVHIFSYLDKCTCVFMCMCIHVYAWRDGDTLLGATCVRMHVCIYVFMYVYTYTHIVLCIA